MTPVHWRQNADVSTECECKAVMGLFMRCYSVDFNMNQLFYGFTALFIIVGFCSCRNSEKEINMEVSLLNKFNEYLAGPNLKPRTLFYPLIT